CRGRSGSPAAPALPSSRAARRPVRRRHSGRARRGLFRFSLGNSLGGLAGALRVNRRDVAGLGLPSAAGAAKLAAVTTTAAHYPGNTAPAPVRHRAARASLLLALACALAACGGGSSVRGDAPASPRGWATLPPGDPAAANAVLMRAISLVGTPYLYGGNTPQSGF